jgi:hypothetical protein
MSMDLSSQCDQIGRNFVLWLLFTWAFLHFQLSKTWFVALIFTLKAGGCTFNFSFGILATVLATFPYIGPIFVQFSGHSAVSPTSSVRMNSLSGIVVATSQRRAPQHSI